MTITADELLITWALHKRPARQCDLAREIAGDQQSRSPAWFSDR